MTQKKLAIVNIGQLCTMDENKGNGGLGILENAIIIVQDGKIDWVGRAEDAADQLKLITEIIDAKGRCAAPAFIDPHTHAVFTGSRHVEYEMRLGGRPYLEILNAGGGILSTVEQVRKCTEDELYGQARIRANLMMAMGTGTVEIKSGYGLSLEDELKMLRVIKRLEEDGVPRILPTFLGAHAVPAEYRDRKDDYVDIVVNEMLPEVARQKLATACDAYLEKGAFGFSDVKRILSKASELGLSVKMHAGQFNNLDGISLAVDLKALSVDHMEYYSSESLETLAASGVSVILLPGAAFSLGMDFPDATPFIDAGVNTAVATDCNPGTSYTENILNCATMAAVYMKMNCDHALRAVTINAARALGIDNNAGSISAGKQADILIFDVDDYRALFYHFGVSHVLSVIINGNMVMDIHR